MLSAILTPDIWEDNAASRKKHRRSWPPSCLRSRTRVNFADMTAVKTCDGFCCRRLVFSYRNGIADSTGRRVGVMSQVAPRHMRTGAGENGCMVKLIVTNTKEIGRSFFNSFASDWVRCCFELHHGIFLLIIIVKTRYNRTIFFTPVIVKYMKKKLRYNENLPYKEQILPVRWALVISRFHCTRLRGKLGKNSSP